jgi:ribosomal protein S24E
MELSKFQNGDKKAIIERKEYSYTISFYLKNKIVSKEITADFAKAEGIAEEYVLSEDEKGPTFLSEDA